MNPDPAELEQALEGLEPLRLSAAQLDRFAAAMDGSLQETPESLAATERRLSAMEPAALSAQLLDRLMGTTAGVDFFGPEKVVQFPAAGDARRRALPPRRWLATAAAVALAGGISAWMLGPDETPRIAAAVGDPAGRAATAGIDPGAFQPAAFGSDVSDTRDLGVMWSQDRKPMRVLRVVYHDRVELTNEKGEQVVMEVPRVEYLMLPETVD